jgi:hypothetical protein
MGRDYPLIAAVEVSIIRVVFIVLIIQVSPCVVELGCPPLIGFGVVSFSQTIEVSLADEVAVFKTCPPYFYSGIFQLTT